MQKEKYTVLIDICHPAEVHHFKNLFAQLSAEGWTIVFAAKDKDVTFALLERLCLPFIKMGATGKTLVEKMIKIPRDVIQFFNIVRAVKPDVILTGNLSLHSAVVSFLGHVPLIAFIDSENRGLLDTLTLPLTALKVTSHQYRKNLGVNHIRYNGNNELAYLHPDLFKPDKRILAASKLEQPFVFFRFVSWTAFHDLGLHGMSLDYKRKLIQSVQKHKRVIISSESPLPDDLKPFEYHFSPENLHHILAYADCYCGEGATTASEAVCLGTPAIYINKIQLGYCDYEKSFGLLYQYDAIDEHNYEPIVNMLCDPDFKNKHQEKWTEFIASADNVAEIMVKILKDLAVNGDEWPRGRIGSRSNKRSAPQ
ncbi:DUF354 domain-containing protein [candidate division KSB1 bacterium]|nr:DUF354 domain-containing protein [candidate division KSB1 bacterium]